VIIRNAVQPSLFSFAPVYSENRFTWRLIWISTSCWSVTHYTYTAKMFIKCVKEKNKGHILYCNQYFRKYRGHLKNYRKETISLRFTNVWRTVTDGLTETRRKEKLYDSQCEFMSDCFISLVLPVWIHVRLFYFFSIVLYHNTILNHM